MLNGRLMFVCLVTFFLQRVFSQGGGQCPLSDDHRCNDGFCIMKEWVCDAITDCLDGSDEANCGGHKCDAAKDFSCTSGQCVLKHLRCDGIVDCGDGSDEVQCPTTEPHVLECKGFKDDIIFVYKNDICDGFHHCPNGEDEADCKKDVVQCGKDEFDCGNATICIPLRWKCDGLQDCPDKSDEAKCDVSGGSGDGDKVKKGDCAKDRFACEEKCIHPHKVCDGKGDCYNGDDENNCNKRSKCTKSDDFDCGGGDYCISRSWLCDGLFDCINHLDETNCTKATTTPKLKTTTVKPACHPDQFDCGNHVCINITKVCDNHADCANDADELGCPAVKTDYCLTTTCHNGDCINLPASFFCWCHVGYSPKDGSITECEDVNECDKYAPCSQICVNLKGSYRCECDTRYYMKADANSTYCWSKTGIARILIAVDGYVGLYDPHTHGIATIHTHEFAPTDLHYDWSDQTVMWYSLIWNVIYKKKIGADKAEVLFSGIPYADGFMAYDWSLKNLYFLSVSASHNKLFVINAQNNRYRELLSNEDYFTHVVGMEADPERGSLYIADNTDSDATVWRISMDGIKIEKATKENNKIRAIAIDRAAGALYIFCDSLWRVDLNNPSSQLEMVTWSHDVLTASESTHPRIDVFENEFYFMNDDAVDSVGKYYSSSLHRIYQHPTKLTSVRIFHEALQPALPDIDCSKCDFLCLRNSFTEATCPCSIGTEECFKPDFATELAKSTTSTPSKTSTSKSPTTSNKKSSSVRPTTWPTTLNPKPTMKMDSSRSTTPCLNTTTSKSMTKPQVEVVFDMQKQEKGRNDTVTIVVTTILVALCVVGLVGGAFYLRRYLLRRSVLFNNITARATNFLSSKGQPIDEQQLVDNEELQPDLRTGIQSPRTQIENLPGRHYDEDRISYA